MFTSWRAPIPDPGAAAPSMVVKITFIAAGVRDWGTLEDIAARRMYDVSCTRRMMNEGLVGGCHTEETYDYIPFRTLVLFALPTFRMSLGLEFGYDR